MRRHVCFVVGARPNFMKAEPVYRGLAELDPDIELLLVHTGQHYDQEMSRVFIDELQLPQPDVFLGVGSGTHAEQTAKVLVGVERVLLERTPSLDLYLGDLMRALEQDEGEKLGGKSAEAARFILRAIDRELDNA